MYTRIPRGTHPESKKPLNEICERGKWTGEGVAEEEEGVWMWLARGRPRVGQAQEALVLSELKWLSTSGLLDNWEVQVEASPLCKTSQKRAFLTHHEVRGGLKSRKHNLTLFFYLHSEFFWCFFGVLGQFWVLGIQRYLNKMNTCSLEICRLDGEMEK